LWYSFLENLLIVSEFRGNYILYSIPMANFFYYDNNGVKQGPVSSSQLKSLTKLGTIVPNTVIETQDGKQARAEKVKGLSFEPVIPPPITASVTPPPLPTQSTGFISPAFQAQNNTNPFAQFGNQPLSNQSTGFDFSGLNLESANYTFPQSTPDPFAQLTSGIPAQPRSTYAARSNNLATIAFRQHMLINTLSAIILLGIVIRIVTRTGIAPEVSFILASVYFALILIWAPFITFVLRKSLGGSTFVSILLCPACILPIGNWVYLWCLSSLATTKLRKAGYEVGFWGADMAQFGYGSHDDMPKYFIAGGISGVVAVIWFFCLCLIIVPSFQKLVAKLEMAQQQVVQQQESVQPQAAEQQAAQQQTAEQQNPTRFKSPVQPFNPDTFPDRRRPSDRMSALREQLQGEFSEVPAETVTDRQSENTRNNRHLGLHLQDIKRAEEEYCRNAFIGACKCAALWDLHLENSSNTSDTPDKIIASQRKEKKSLERQYKNVGIDKKVKYAELSKELKGLEKALWKNQVRDRIIFFSFEAQRQQTQHVQPRPQPVPSQPQPVAPRFGYSMPNRGLSETFADNLLNDDAKIMSIIEQHFEKE
jgi:hypothetical protein